MTTSLKDLRERRGRLVTEMRGLLDAATADTRDLSIEEQARYDALFADQERVGIQIGREERQQDLDRHMAEEIARGADPSAGRSSDLDALSREDRANPRATPEYRAAFARFLRGGVGVLAGEELRALQAGADVDGGYLVAPQQFVAELIKAVDDQVAIRGLARTFQVPQAASLGAPSLDADPSDADWTTELQTGTEDTAMKLGKRELRPHPLAKRIKISQQLLRQALIGPEGLVLDRLAYKFAVTQEKAFLTGSGAGRPLGVFTASPNGISTGRDVATGNTATAIGFDGLIEAKFTLKGQYWPRARWFFHRDAVKQVTKLKDGDGQYIDMANYEGVVFVAAFGTLSAGAVTGLKAQQGLQANLSDAADVAGTALAIADTEDNKLLVLDLFRPAERYVRAVVTRGTADAVIDGVVAIQYGTRVLPTTPGRHRRRDRDPRLARRRYGVTEGAMSYTVKIYRGRGGDRLVVEAGGIVQLKTGGQIVGNAGTQVSSIPDLAGAVGTASDTIIVLHLIQVRG